MLALDVTGLVPAGTWADSESKLYVPSRCAVCYWQTANPVDQLRDATDVVGRLPAPVQALLRGKERTYNNPGLFSSGYPPAPVECSEVTSGEARVLERMLNDGSYGAGQPGLLLSPILPPGEWVMWGG